VRRCKCARLCNESLNKWTNVPETRYKNRTVIMKGIDCLLADDYLYFGAVYRRFGKIC
jgi:hypothetical protein